jgi:hypothetical protein
MANYTNSGELANISEGIAKVEAVASRFESFIMTYSKHNQIALLSFLDELLSIEGTLSFEVPQKPREAAERKHASDVAELLHLMFRYAMPNRVSANGKTVYYTTAGEAAFSMAVELDSMYGVEGSITRTGANELRTAIEGACKVLLKSPFTLEDNLKACNFLSSISRCILG